MVEKLGVKDSLVILGIAYYLRRSIKDLKSAYERNKPFMTDKAVTIMSMMINSKDPVTVMEAGLAEIDKE